MDVAVRHGTADLGTYKDAPNKPICALHADVAVLQAAALRDLRAPPGILLVQRQSGLPVPPVGPPAPARRGPCWGAARRQRAGTRRRPATQVPALLPGLRGHRGADPDPRPRDLPLGLQPQRQHHLLVALGTKVGYLG